MTIDTKRLRRLLVETAACDDGCSRGTICPNDCLGRLMSAAVRALPRLLDAYEDRDGEHEIYEAVQDRAEKAEADRDVLQMRLAAAMQNVPAVVAMAAERDSLRAAAIGVLDGEHGPGGCDVDPEYGACSLCALRRALVQTETPS